MFTQAPLANSFAYFVILKSDDGKQIHIEDCKVPVKSGVTRLDDLLCSLGEILTHNKSVRRD